MTRKSTIVSLKNDAFKNFLTIRYLADNSYQESESINHLDYELFPDTVWNNLCTRLKEDLLSTGGQLTIIDQSGENLVSVPETTRYPWPSERVWVLESGRVKKL